VIVQLRARIVRELSVGRRGRRRAGSPERRSICKWFPGAGARVLSLEDRSTSRPALLSPRFVKLCHRKKEVMDLDRNNEAPRATDATHCRGCLAPSIGVEQQEMHEMVHGSPQDHSWWTIHPLPRSMEPSRRRQPVVLIILLSALGHHFL
jgi:hypothetical protein